MRLYAGIFLALVEMSAMAAVKIERVNYHGWPNCYRVSNQAIELVVTADVGPRIIRCAWVGGRNLFKEFPEQLGRSGEKEYQLRGGHRLWVAPERLETSWAPDNGPVEIRIEGEILRAIQPVDSAGLQKTIVVRMDPEQPRVELIHEIRNTLPWTIELAPWALTMMAPGGVAITGFPPRGKHPEVLLPTNPLVMWAYTDLSDPRWVFTKKYLVLRQDSRASEPQKIGLFHARTWGACLLGDELFLKTTTANPAVAYPDFGCSFEMFTNAEMLELETLGPLQRLESHSQVTHIEHWSLHRGIRVEQWTDEVLDRAIAPLLP